MSNEKLSVRLLLFPAISGSGQGWSLRTLSPSWPSLTWIWIRRCMLHLRVITSFPSLIVEFKVTAAFRITLYTYFMLACCGFITKTIVKRHFSLGCKADELLAVFWLHNIQLGGTRWTNAPGELYNFLKSSFNFALLISDGLK